MRIFCPLHRDLEEHYELEIGEGDFGDMRTVRSEAMALELVYEMGHVGRQILCLRALRHRTRRASEPTGRLEARLAAWQDLLAYRRRPHTGHVLDCRHIEDLICHGHLDQYIMKPREPSLRPKGPVERQVDVIVCGPVVGGVSSSARKAYSHVKVQKRP
ncbi:hypothetical protein B296_00001726 [Ensete ventricosum]|uniref:Uncharacterized protein n=1 Tax=Ensete ventricosum TaxID=4639 RepID=A0A427BBM5_ENSVE|nr:hypothetical protein B296_00001726 [Ensete ventricosum]